MTWRARLPRPDDIPEPVHDGDTCWLETDQGDWDRKVRDCRLFNVYAPELDQDGGPDTRQFVVDWINYHNIGKWPFVVDTIQTAKGLDILTFGRFVSIISVSNADRSSKLNDEVMNFVRIHNYPPGRGFKGAPS